MSSFYESVEITSPPHPGSVLHVTWFYICRLNFEVLCV